jgi:hypothetical protein
MEGKRDGRDSMGGLQRGKLIPLAQKYKSGRIKSLIGEKYW